MLKEFAGVARDMLFLHGHLVRLDDVARTAPATREKSAAPVQPKRNVAAPKLRSRTLGTRTAHGH